MAATRIQIAHRARSLRLWGACGCLLLMAAGANAGDWTTRWSAGTGVAYTDNVRLDSPGEEESDLFLRLIPSFQAQGVSGRSTTNIVAGANAGVSLIGSGNSFINPLLQANTTYEIIKQQLFLNAGANIRRTFSLRDDRISSTGLNDSGSTAASFNISPTWQHHFGTYADLVARYRYSQSFFNENSISNTNTQNLDVNATSGRGTPRLIWGANLRIRDSNGDNDNYFLDSNFDFAYNMAYDLQFVGTYARFDSTADEGDIPDANDGTRARVGLAWTPSARSSLRFLAGPSNWSSGATWGVSNKIFLSGTYGKNGRDSFSDLTGGRPFWDATMRWNPSPRTSMNVSYRRPELGLNSERANWIGLISHNRQRMNFRAQLTQETTTSQRLLEESGFITDPDTGDPIVDDDGNLLLGSVPTISDTNDIFVRRVLRLDVTHSTRKSSFGIGGSAEDRDFNNNSEDQRVYRARFNWGYNFTQQTSFNLNLSVINTQFGDTDDKDYQYLARLGLRKRLSSRASLTLSYFYNRRDSDDSSREFTENAVQLLLQVNSKRGGAAGAGGLGVGGFGGGFDGGGGAAAGF